MSELNDRVGAIAHRQHGLATRADLREAGMSDSRIGHWVQEGRLRRTERGVFFVVGAVYSWHTRVLAPVLASGGLASYRTANVLWGLDGFRPGRPEIAVPPESGFRRPDVRVHRTAEFGRIDRVTIAGIPTTGIIWTLFLSATFLGYEDLEAVLDEILNRRLTTWSQIIDLFVVYRARGRKGTARLRRLIDARYGDERGTESTLERRFARLCRELGFPVPRPQVKIVDENGVEIMRADFGIESIKEAFELDSKRHHATGQALTADRVKRRRARQMGWKINEYTDEIMRRQPLLIAEDLRDAYERLERFEEGLWLPPSCEDERRRGSRRHADPALTGPNVDSTPLGQRVE